MHFVKFENPTKEFCIGTLSDATVVVIVLIENRKLQLIGLENAFKLGNGSGREGFSFGMQQAKT